MNQIGISLGENFAHQDTMDVYQVSSILGVHPEAIKKHIRELYPDSIKNGRLTHLTQAQITRIKEQMRPTTKVVASVTDLEMLEKMQDVLNWSVIKIAELVQKNKELEPKAEFHDQIASAPDCYSVSDAVRILDLKEGRNRFFVRLRSDKVLMSDNMPYQDQIDSGHFRVVVSIKNGKSIQTPLVTGSGLSYLQRKYKELRK